MEVNIDNRSGQDLPIARIEELVDFAVRNVGYFEDFSEEQLALLELSISFVDIEEITELNAEYRNLAKPTDVLSFEMDLSDSLAYVDDLVGDDDVGDGDDDDDAVPKEQFDSASESQELDDLTDAYEDDDECLSDQIRILNPEPDFANIMLGDIVINPDVAKEHAVLEELNLEEEIWVLVIHGILHLLGYDHENAEEAAMMEDLEDRLLTKWFEKVELV